MECPCKEPLHFPQHCMPWLPLPLHLSEFTEWVLAAPVIDSKIRLHMLCYFADYVILSSSFMCKSMQVKRGKAWSQYLARKWVPPPPSNSSQEKVLTWTNSKSFPSWNFHIRLESQPMVWLQPPGGRLSQQLSAKSRLRFLTHWKFEMINMHCFEPLSWPLICHTALDKHTCRECCADIVSFNSNIYSVRQAPLN